MFYSTTKCKQFNVIKQAKQLSIEVPLMLGLFFASFMTVSFYSEIAIANANGEKEKFTGVKSRQIYYMDEKVKAIDIHFHAADSFDQLGPVAQKFIKENLPAFIPDFLKDFSLRATTGMIYNPFGLFGIQGECIGSGFSHCGLFATYAPNSWGVISNEYILGKLNSPKNKDSRDGGKMLFGLASIDVLNWKENELANLKKLDEALNEKLFKGIKLAFIHNEVALDVEAYDSIYEMARKHNVPVYHHVGSSPLRTLDDFKTEEEKRNYLKSYDPTLLTRAVEKFGDVKFIFGHMGFDFNSEGYDFSDEVLRLASEHSNIYLEISAFGRDQFDPESRFMDHVLSKLKSSRLLGRTIFGSDGPLFPGATKQYLLTTLQSMERVGYTRAEVEAVLYGNSKAIFDL